MLEILETIYELSNTYSGSIALLYKYLGGVWFAQGNRNGMRKGNEGERNGFP